MSALAFYKSLREAGMDEACALLAAEKFEEAIPEYAAKVSSGAERTRRYRDRKASQSVTERHQTSQTSQCDIPPTPSLSPPDPPKPTPTPVSVTTHTREADDFEVFWKAYPRKTAKADARKAFSKAAKQTPVAEMLGGLERAKAGWDEVRFIPHPATWLNGSRWQDEASDVIQPNPRKANDRPHHNAKFDATQANLARAFAGADHASGPRWEP